MELPKKAARVLAPFVVLFALVGFFVWRSHTVNYHLAGMEKAARIITAYDSSSKPLMRSALSKSDKLAVLMHQSPVYWSDSWLAHQEALVKKGYLTRLTVTLTNQSLTVEQMRTNAEQRFPESTNIATIWSSTNHTITIVVPTKEIDGWKEFMAELDRRNP